MTYPTIRPEITLDFQNSRQLDPRITFSRSSGATYLNPDTGLITSAYTDQARFEDKGLLIEEQRTNYIPNSTDFTGWNQHVSASIALSSAVTAPDGGTSSSLFTADNGIGYVQLPYVIPGNTTAYLTLFVKAASENVFRLNSSRSSTMRGLFDMTTGLWSSIAGSANDYTAEAYPNGWWKLTVKGFIAGTSTIVLYAAAPNITSAGTDAFYMWGCQIEHGSFPTSYIPTAGSTVTRAADRPSVTGTNFSSWYNHNEGSFVAKVNDFGGTPPQFKIIFEGAKVNKYADFSLQISNLEPRFTTLYTFTNGTISLGSLPSNDTSFKMAGSYSSLGTAAVLNGGVVGTTGTTGVVDTNILSVDIGHRAYVNDVHLNGHISRLSYYTRRLSDSELQTITS